MMKRFFLSFPLLVSASQLVTTHADIATVDNEAGLFTIGQVHSLEQQAEELSERIKGRILIVTTTSNSEEPRDFADNYLRETVGSDRNGSVLLLDTGQHEVYISTSGNMIDYLTGSRIDSVLDDVYGQVTNATYYDAVKAYLSKSVIYAEDGVPGDHYCVDEETGRITCYKVLMTMEIIIAVVSAPILSLIFYSVTVSCYQLRSGIYKYPFREKFGTKLTERIDHLTDLFAATRRIPKSPSPGNGDGGSTIYSSGGGTFGSGGRNF